MPKKGQPTRLEEVLDDVRATREQLGLGSAELRWKPNRLGRVVVALVVPEASVQARPPDFRRTLAQAFDSIRKGRGLIGARLEMRRRDGRVVFALVIDPVDLVNSRRERFALASEQRSFVGEELSERERKRLARMMR